MEKTNIAKNTSYFTLALIIQKIISFTYFTLLARNLVPEQLGKYYFAIGFTTIFAIFIDLGLANVATREIAKASDRAKDILSAVVLIKIPLALLSIISALVLVNLLGYPELTRQLVYLSAICMTLDSFSLIFYACMRGLHNLKFESIGVVVFQLIVLVFGLTVIKLNLGLLWLISATVAASSFNFLYSLSLIRFKWKIKLSFKFNPRLTKLLIAITIPFALYAVFQRLFMYLDTVFLSLLAGDKYVGLYQVPFKIVFALQFLPMAFMASLYPAFASYWKTEKKSKNTPVGTEQCSVPTETSPSTWTEHCSVPTEISPTETSPSTWTEQCSVPTEISPSALPQHGSVHTAAAAAAPQLVVSFERAMNYLLIISLPLSIGIIALADKIMLLFKPEYMDAVLPLRLIILAMIFIFINFPIGALLNACDRQATNTRNMGLTLIFSIILNLILIPRFQAVGASLTVIAANLFLFILGLRVVPRIISVRPKKIISVFFKSLLSVAAMGIFILIFKQKINIFIIIPLSGIIYFGFLYLFKGFRREDVLSIAGAFWAK